MSMSEAIKKLTLFLAAVFFVAMLQPIMVDVYAFIKPYILNADPSKISDLAFRIFFGAEFWTIIYSIYFITVIYVKGLRNYFTTFLSSFRSMRPEGVPEGTTMFLVVAVWFFSALVFYIASSGLGMEAVRETAEVNIFLSIFMFVYLWFVPFGVSRVIKWA